MNTNQSLDKQAAFWNPSKKSVVTLLWPAVHSWVDWNSFPPQRKKFHDMSMLYEIIFFKILLKVFICSEKINDFFLKDL